MAVTMPVFRPKQSARLAAQLNSPPLTWIAHWLALRKGMMPGSRRWTSAPIETKSSAASLRTSRPYFMVDAPRGRLRASGGSLPRSVRGALGARRGVPRGGNVPHAVEHLSRARDDERVGIPAPRLDVDAAGVE